MGSAATVTAATISSTTMILGSSRAIRKPFQTRDWPGSGRSRVGACRSSTTVKKQNEPAFSAKAQPNPMVAKMSTPKTGASARPRL